MYVGVFRDFVQATAASKGIWNTMAPKDDPVMTAVRSVAMVGLEAAQDENAFNLAEFKKSVLELNKIVGEYMKANDITSKNYASTYSKPAVTTYN